MIKFENVNLKYVEEFYSLLSFSFTFNKNTIILGGDLDGANSILRLIAKFDKIYDGEIFINNTNIKNIKDKELNVAFVSSSPYLFKHKNLEYNLGYGLKIRKIDKKNIRNCVKNAIFTYNLEYLNKKIKNLSVAELKLISLLRAVLWKPKYLLLENFFENLNPDQISKALKIINDYKGLIIACEKQNLNLLTNFEVIEFNGGILKKD